MAEDTFVYVRLTHWKKHPVQVAVFNRLDDAMRNTTDEWCQRQDEHGCPYNWSWTKKTPHPDVEHEVITKERVCE